ncbi:MULTISPECIES: GNAT family N-acetyltransferase [Paenibacillus]|uniref:GNAT family N-acetyltransferase n=1 Tax=Paenibacillus TaxID=44249 RepID=UPI00201D6EAE|nr:GNAT family N-acetyltransferase [Paenibacillus amylolyticus]MCL6658571.1 GNAT family N-acetyltransferase [Paenibacillus amylolyticus]
MNIKIREIILDDYAEVVFLWNDVLEIRNVNDADFRVTMEEMNKAGNYKTFVALIDNDVVGFVTIVQSLSVGVPIGYLHIQALAVKRELQNRGIGTKLLRQTENYAKERGISSIILCSGMKRTNAHAFYEHNGYDRDSYCFDKVIDLTH